MRKDGSVAHERFFYKLDAPLESGEQIVGEEVQYYENGKPASILRFNPYGESIRDRNFPMLQKFDENSKRTSATFYENGEFIRREE